MGNLESFGKYRFLHGNVAFTGFFPYAPEALKELMVGTRFRASEALGPNTDAEHRVPTSSHPMSIRISSQAPLQRVQH
jgi:hypothetical protein